VDVSHPLRVVTPTLDGDVLAALALADSSFTPGQLHRLIPQHSEDGIRRVLRRLVGQGIVLADRAGNTYLYRFNTGHLAAQPIRALAALRKTLLDRIEQKLAAWDPPPVYGALFGSAARGTMHVDSDIDLLIIRPADGDPAEWDENVAELATAVTSWTGNDTRVLEFTESEVLQVGRMEPVLADVRDHGLTVAGSPAWLREVLRSREPKRATK
jgi:predicted nucleotidyltransferase